MPLVDDHHRLLLGPTAATAWSRRLATLPAADGATMLVVGRLCHEPDLEVAARRLHDDLPPGGRVIFLEHVGRPGMLGHLERAWGTSTARFPWSCHVGRDIPAALRRAAFFISDLERFTMPTPVPALRSWVHGTAVRS